MNLLCLTTPITHPEFDTTVELYNRLASDSRIRLFHGPATSVTSTLITPQPRLKVAPIEAPLTYAQFLALDEYARQDMLLADIDLVYCRTDQPYPVGYLEALTSWEGNILFVNRPSSLQETKPKAFCSQMASDFLPPHVMTRKIAEACDFLAKWGTIVCKENLSYGGKGVYRVFKEDKQFACQFATAKPVLYPSPQQLFQDLFSNTSEPYQLVRYLPLVTAGDKRVLVVGEEVYGAYLRKSATGEWIQNITAGGKAEKATLTEKEEQIIATTLPEYLQRGVHTLGYDFLMNDDETWVLSEINAGNIGGYGRLSQVTGIDYYPRLIDWLIDYSKDKI